MRQNKNKPIIYTSLLVIVGFGILLAAFLFSLYDEPFLPTPVFASRKPLVEGASTVAVASEVDAAAPDKASPASNTKSSAPANGSCSSAFTQEFLCLLNAYRASQGKKKLVYDNAIANVAANYSSWMNKTATFSHTGQNGSRFTDRCKAANLTCSGENLAKNFSSAQELLNMWKASPGHNKNLLRDSTGIGLGISGNYATLLFK